MADQPLPPDDQGQDPGETVEVPAPGAPGDQGETSRLERKKLTIREDVTSEVSPGETVAMPGPGDTQSSALVDPTRRRDTNTASLRRLRPQTEADDVDADPDNTETVNIKVIKEQKKQYRNMMTSSQTLRVKPEDAAQAPSIAATPTQQAGDEAKRTLKIKAAEETRTESIPRPSPTQTAAATGQHSPKSTLKIKAPPGVAPAQSGGNKPGATLKIKAPAPAAAQTQAAPAPAPGQTVRQEAPKKAGRTLKLRSGAPAAAQQQSASRTSARQAPAVEGEEEYDDVDPIAVPGFGYAIPSIAAIAAVAIVIVKIVMSSNELFDGKFF